MTIIDLTLQDLRYVVAVAQEKHFGRAASSCFVSQPTLSTQIRKLEEQLGVSLFERTNKKVEITAAGERFVEQALVVLDEADKLREVAGAVGDPLSGQFRLGIISTLSPYLLPWFLPVLKRRYPVLRLGVREGLTDDLLNELSERDLDAVLAAAPLRSPGVTSEVLFDEPFSLVCPLGHPLAGKRTLSAADLRNHQLLLLTEGHCLRDQALEVCRTHAGKLEDDFLATSLETLIELVAAGHGCTLAPALALPSVMQRQKNLAVAPFQSRQARRRIVIAFRQSSPRKEAVWALSRLIRKHAPAAVTVVPE